MPERVLVQGDAGAAHSRLEPEEEQGPPLVLAGIGPFADHLTTWPVAICAVPLQFFQPNGALEIRE